MTKLSDKWSQIINDTHIKETVAVLLEQQAKFRGYREFDFIREPRQGVLVNEKYNGNL